MIASSELVRPDPPLVASPVRRTAAARTSTDGRVVGDGGVVTRAARDAVAVAVGGGTVGAAGTDGALDVARALTFRDAALVADREVRFGVDVAPAGVAGVAAGVAWVAGGRTGWVVCVVGDGAGRVVRGAVRGGRPASACPGRP